ncbi:MULTISPECIES: hypothetical protein [Haloarcula]|uniref:hypothetical protein n=1 Tax=Haloarcula TaxID=2237 RepID=UPI0023E8914F|nr:hypothetical protein [Halomicroarcula sp. SHR3]
MPTSLLEKSRQGFRLARQTTGTALRHLRYATAYGRLAPRPYDLIHVDPARIEYCTLPSLQAQFDLSTYGSHLLDGEWDRHRVYDDVWYTRGFAEPVRARFEDHALYRAMEAHFSGGVAWRDTDWYQWIRDHPGVVGQYPDEERMRERLAQVDTLYEHIRSGQYRTQRELRDCEDVPLYSRPLPVPEHYEVDVNIGRSGELLFNFNGRHRLAIAKLLGLDSIPVRVFARHEQWQEKRKHARYRTSESAIADHPDVPGCRSVA